MKSEGSDEQKYSNYIKFQIGDNYENIFIHLQQLLLLKYLR